jgi:tRNA A37 threonylcarbamoyladenosine dehydratase
MEWLSRTEMLLGKDSLEKLQSSHVLVVGIGGVGAYTAEMLARAGIGTLTIVDGDTVKPSNRNRQLIALQTTEGQFKTEIMAKRLYDINPKIKIEMVTSFIKDEQMIDVVCKPFDYVVDAIDTLSPKVYLLYHALQHNHRIVSSMGAGGKLDATKIKIDDLSKTYNCRLAYVLRKRLRKLQVTNGIKAVFSTEQIDTQVDITDEEPNKKSIIGTISYLPAIFGCMCASVVVRDLVDLNK